VSIERKIKKRTERRVLRTRKGLQAKQLLPRVSVFRSLKHIYAQLIDDLQHKTLASCSTLECKSLKGDKKAVAHGIGLKLAKKLKELGINAVIFDRGRYLYHGRVKALAEGLREGGIKI
jgi:large subunit ribosomal protein L18